MKVVQILPELDTGGVEQGTLEVARHLAARGHESLVLSGGGRLVERLLAEGSRHFTLPVGRKSPRTVWLVPRLRRWLRAERPDLLHLRSRVPAWVAVLACRGLPAAARPHLVTTFHGFYSVNRWSAVMTKGERVICVSRAIREHIVNCYPSVDPAVLRVIPRGIDPAVFPHGHRPTAAWMTAFQQEFPATRGQRLITLPGRVTRLKGHDDLLEILRQLDDPSVHGLIAGGAHPRKQAYLRGLMARIEALGLGGRVTVTGPRDDLREVLAVSDVVLSLTNQPESFGRTTLEALGLGRPVVGYAHGGVAEILAAVFPAGQVPPGDHAAAAARVREFLASPPVVPGEHPFTLQRMLDETLAVYQELAGSCGSQDRNQTKPPEEPS
jgi:glycosyltransferase involved in cell wall biosynthesis